MLFGSDLALNSASRHKTAVWLILSDSECLCVTANAHLKKERKGTHKLICGKKQLSFFCIIDACQIWLPQKKLKLKSREFDTERKFNHSISK